MGVGYTGNSLALPTGEQKPRSPWLSHSGLWVLCSWPQLLTAPSILPWFSQEGRAEGPCHGQEPAISSVFGFEIVMFVQCETRNES